MTKNPCESITPPWFVGRWQDWHRGHGCSQDDGKPRSAAAIAEIAQHEANKDTGCLTDAELSFLRTCTTSGDTLIVRALDELMARRSTSAAAPPSVPRLSGEERLHFLLEHGEELALCVECPNETCAAEQGQRCTPYTHFIRVRAAINAGHLATMVAEHERTRGASRAVSAVTRT